MRSRRRAPCCRPASSTSPGTCRSRTRSSCAWRRAARAASSSRKGGGIEHIQLNNTDPWTEVDGERSSLKTKHPILSDPAVRQALALLVDKDSVEKHIYGRTGMATANFINNPERFRSKTTKYEFNVDKANAILDKAGWKKGADGIRDKDGKKLKFVYQTSINQPRQKNQAIVKQACQKAGIDIEVKAVTASVFFSSDVANPDTYTKFYCDLQMYNNGTRSPTRRCSCASSARGKRPPRRTSGRAATSRAGRTRNTTTSTRRPRSSSIRSSAPPC